MSENNKHHSTFGYSKYFCRDYWSQPVPGAKSARVSNWDDSFRVRSSIFDRTLYLQSGGRGDLVREHLDRRNIDDWILKPCDTDEYEVQKHGESGTKFVREWSK